MNGRKPTSGQMTSERQILRDYLDGKLIFNTEVPMVSGRREIDNPIDQSRLGLFVPVTARRSVTSDVEMLTELLKVKNEIPSFLEAGPRQKLRIGPYKLKAAIVTTGGLAPGIHSVIHGIVKRHNLTYQLAAEGAGVTGIYDGFRGLCDLVNKQIDLAPHITEPWLDQGGSKLRNVRYYGSSKPSEGEPSEESASRLADEITKNLDSNHIDILYVIGGDGSLKVAHKIAEKNPARSVVGIPKTMDNDVLWVSHSFGFDTAVEQATHVINALCAEAESTRRVCVVELFGAESGFVAAQATLASGHVRLVLIPEVFNLLEPSAAQVYLDQVVSYVDELVDYRGRVENYNPHAVVVVAEGVETILRRKGVSILGEAVTKDNFVRLLGDRLKKQVLDASAQPVDVIENRPRHYIRAVAANAQDHVYCYLLGALAVDTALAGYTDVMISHWQMEFVLVPLRLVEGRQRGIDVRSMFWKQVVESTGQPLSPVELA